MNTVIAKGTFIRTNVESYDFFMNLSIWAVIFLKVVVFQLSVQVPGIQSLRPAAISFPTILGSY